MNKLQRAEYCGDTLDLAKNVILGAFLYTNTGDGLTGGIITEVEAYLGGVDKASHSYCNKRTKRTEIQFGPGGYVYVYLVYGMHCLFNIVTSDIGKPEVVLIRAVEPTDGIDIMFARRKTDNVKKLSVGPGNVCAALGIGLKDYGADLTGDRIFLCKNPDKPKEIGVSARIGIDYAEEYKDVPWRFYLADNQFVSKMQKRKG